MNQSDSGKHLELSPATTAAQAERYAGLLWASAVLSTMGVVLAGAYVLWTDCLVIQALSLELALCALPVWLSVNAQRICRHGGREAAGAGKDVPAASGNGGSARWGDADYGDIEETRGREVSWDVEHDIKLHYLFLAAVPSALILFLAARRLWSSSTGAVTAPATGQAIAIGLLCLGASCLWLVLAKSYEGISEEEFPARRALGLAYRDLQWASVLVCAGLVGSIAWLPAEAWTGRLLLVWVLLVGGEQLGRAVFAWLHASPDARVQPLRAVVREMVLLHGNPLGGLSDAIETSFGVSFRASWAIRFVRRALLPGVGLVGLLLVALSSLSVVRVDELGVRESFGRVQGDPLAPGLNWKLPWPFGRVLRYPVKQVFTKSIGFVSAPGRQASYLWSQKHAEEEFALVLGDGAELVAIDSVVYYKIHEDRQRFLDYVYRHQNPQDALEAYAYRALMEQTRSVRLRDVLTANRAEFARQLLQKLRDYAATNRLGIEVVDVALIGLHPPVEAASDYLDVISAGIDAERFETEATGEKLVRIVDAQRESSTAVATAKAEASQRVGEAFGESAEFLAIGEAYAVAPDAFRLRLWIEALEEVLETKRFVLVDKTFASGPGGILIDQRSGALQEDPVPLVR